MIKRIVFVLFISVLVGTAQAQLAEADWGTPFKQTRWGGFEEVLGETADGFFVTRKKKTGLITYDLYIEKYSKENFAQEFSTVVYNEQMYSESSKKNRVMEVNGALMLNENIVVFISEYDKKDDTYTSYAQKVNLNGELDGGLVTLDVYKTPEKSLRGRFEFGASPDKKHVLLYHKRPFKIYNDEKFKIKKFTEELQLVWEKDFVFPYKDKDFNLTKIAVMNDGYVYMMARVFLDNEEAREKKNNKEATYYYKLLSFADTDTIQDEKLKETDISISKKWITDVEFTTRNDEIICAGFYADKKDMAINGMFFLRIERSSGKIRAQDTEEFSKAFLAEFLGDKKAERGVGLRDFELDDLILNNDGSIVLVAEQFFIKTVCTTDSRGFTRCRDYYYFNDILVVSINSKGEIEWNARVPKRQVDSRGGYYLSYALAVKGEKLYFLYNENPKNLQVTDPRLLKFVNIPKSVAVLAEVNSKGEVSRDALFSAKELNKVYMRPNMCHQINASEMIIFAINGKNNMWGKLKLY